ncbi:MAG: putative enzyme [Hyphomicrobiales bacterium]|nr:putative enzyme [Hyphomicrobiales bacterium]
MVVFDSIYFYASYIVPFVFVLSVVVFFHELGHFAVGRWCGVKVDVFSLGFGPELLHFIDKKGTRWRLAALPLGGFVKFHGDLNAASVADHDAVAAMPADERAVSFFAQKVWKRAAIVVAGPVANFILSIVIFTFIFFSFGREVLSPRVNEVRPNEAGAMAGFEKGDLIVSIDGAEIGSWADMQRIVQASTGTPLTFVVRRGAKEVTLTAVPGLRELKTPFGTQRVGMIGLTAAADPSDWRIERYGIGKAAQLAVSETWYIVDRTGAYLGGLFAGREAADNISGPIGIAHMAGEVAKVGIVALFHFAAVLSVSVGLINLMPIPLLDGGHLLYYAVESLRGRPLSERAQEMGFRVGIAIVGALMLFATANDIFRRALG